MCFACVVANSWFDRMNSVLNVVEPIMNKYILMIEGTFTARNEIFLQISSFYVISSSYVRITNTWTISIFVLRLHLESPSKKLHNSSQFEKLSNTIFEFVMNLCVCALYLYGEFKQSSRHSSTLETSWYTESTVFKILPDKRLNSHSLFGSSAQLFSK